MSSIKSKIFTCILSTVMLMSILPTTVFADSIQPNNSSIKIENTYKIYKSGKCGKELYWVLKDDTLTIYGKGAMDNYPLHSPAPWCSYKPTKIIIRNGITSIGNFAFYTTYATSIDMSEVKTLKTIGHHAFAINRLESITIPNGVTKIDYLAFANSGIKKIKIPSSVKTIETGAFQGCKKLQSVEGGSGLVTIAAGVFYNCPNLSKVKITSKKLKKIGGYAFGGCKKLTVLNITYTTKLTKAGVKKSLKESSIKTVKVKKSKIKTYKKYFTKSNCGRKVKIIK